MIRAYALTGTVSAAQTFSVSTPNPVRGKILAVEINYPAATVALTLTAAGHHAQTILSLAAANTDRTFYPRAYAEKTDGTTLLYTTGEEVPVEFVVDGILTLAATSGTATQIVTARVLVEE